MEDQTSGGLSSNSYYARRASRLHVISHTAGFRCWSLATRRLEKLQNETDPTRKKTVSNNKLACRRHVTSERREHDGIHRRVWLTHLGNLCTTNCLQLLRLLPQRALLSHLSGEPAHLRLFQMHKTTKDTIQREISKVATLEARPEHTKPCFDPGRITAQSTC